ncbi:ABC transporter permease [Selenomonas sp. TAMA-11512]|uniref:ABC transporter permease n=1 Tax=Selenomonas sp. TAMA-11512 TaxID=3095337 RepID=UPI00308A34CA|nr:ABC transporter permease [Selenomonas sp. TAMA-11512]
MLYDVWTVFWRDWIVLRHHLVKYILSRMVPPLLYLVAFGWGLGRSITVTDGSSYLDFLVPGILALNSMMIAFSSIITVHAERVYHKSLDVYLSAPIHPSAFVLGKLLGASFRSLLSSIIILVLAYISGARLELTPLFLLVLLVNSMIFAAIGFYASMKIDTYAEMGQVNTYILLPMSFLCGTFFSVATLPSAIRMLLELLPLTHTSQLLRTLAGGGDGSPTSYLILLLYAFISFLLAQKAFVDLKR